MEVLVSHRSSKCLPFMLLLYMLICSLRERAQVEQLLRFIVEESPEDADSKRAFKYVHFSFLFFSSRYCFP